MTSIDTAPAAKLPTHSEPAAAPPEPSRLKRLLRLACSAAAVGVVAAYSANVLWKTSGSNEWKLELERDGVAIYSLKAPGAYVKQYKAVMRGNFTLTQLVAGLIENSTLDVCKKHIPGCVDMQVIEPWNSRTMTNTVLWKLALPAPFSPRESLIRAQVSQDPGTKVVTVDVIAAPNSVALNPDSVRITHLQNRWRYTPLGNGQVEIEFLQDIDLGGMFPSFLLNIAGAEQTYTFIHDQLPPLLDQDLLRTVRYDFIAEAQ